MGAKRSEYERNSPKNSFIHVDDFESPKELAKYLHKLDSNDDLYNEYFKWKGTGEFINTCEERNYFCTFGRSSYSFFFFCTIIFSLLVSSLRLTT